MYRNTACWRRVPGQTIAPNTERERAHDVHVHTVLHTLRIAATSCGSLSLRIRLLHLRRKKKKKEANIISVCMSVCASVHVSVVLVCVSVCTACQCVRCQCVCVTVCWPVTVPVMQCLRCLVHVCIKNKNTMLSSAHCFLYSWNHIHHHHQHTIVQGQGVPAR